MPLNTSGPSPWLPILGSAAVTIGGLVWGASERASDLRHEIEARSALEHRVETLETSRGDMREVLAGLRSEMTAMRNDMADMKALMRNWTTKYVSHP